jgi:hypothetical protein
MQYLTTIFVIYFTCTAFLQSIGAQIIDLKKGLDLYLAFDGNAEDSSGHGKNAIMYNSSYGKDRFGNPNGAASLDGSNGFITLNLGESPHSDFRTISLWMCPFSYQNQILLSFGKSEGVKNCRRKGQNLGIITDVFFTNYVQNIITESIPLECESLSHKKFLAKVLAVFKRRKFEINNSKTGFIDYNMETRLLLSKWHNLTFTISREGYTTWINGIKIYTYKINNDVEIRLNRFDEVPKLVEVYTMPSNSNITFGASNYTNGTKPKYHNFYGLVDDFRIYNRVLNDDEIKELSRRR